MAVTAPPRAGSPGDATPSRSGRPWRARLVATRAAFGGTPGRLRLAGIVTMAACLMFGAFALVGATERATALADARAAAGQLVRVQDIRTNLVRADANLTNAFLVGGLEPASARAAYQQGIAAAAGAIAVASGDNARDAAVLAGVNEVVTRYTGLVESARANNRLGYPLGAAYLRQATSLLRTDALPPLAELGTTQQRRIEHAYSTSANAAGWPIAGLAVALVVLLATQLWLSARTRRTFNVPLAAGTAIVLVVGGVLLGVLTTTQSTANDARRGAYFTTLELATARVDAFDAKSAESLTLIARGQGQAYDASYDNLAANVRALLDDASTRAGAGEAATRQAFATYQDVHARIRQADDAGDWDAAVGMATGAGPDDANATFAQFDHTSATALAYRSAQLRHDLGEARAPLLTFGWLGLVGGVAAAVAAGWGISTRLREYR